MPERGLVDTLVEPSLAAQGAVTAGGEKAGHDPIAGLEPFDLAAHVLHHADELVPENRPCIHRGMPVEDVKVGAANRSEGDPDQRVAGAFDGRLGNVHDFDVARALKRQRFHCSGRILRPTIS